MMRVSRSGGAFAAFRLSSIGCGETVAYLILLIYCLILQGSLPENQADRAAR